MELKYDKIQTTGTDTPLKIVKGHFATNHAHTNYYFDLTTVKSRLSEAGGIAQALVHMYLYDMIVDTIVCMEGTEVIGTLLAQELTCRRTPTRRSTLSSRSSTATARSCLRTITAQ